MVQTNNDCRFRIFTLTNSLHQQRLLVGRIRFKTEVGPCSQFPTEAMLWIKEVEMVESVDELRSSSSVRGIGMPDFELLDARIASALNRIIHNSHIKRRVSLEEQKAQKEDRFLRGRQIRLPDLRVLLGHWSHDSVEKYADLFTIALQNDDIQEFDSKWNGILLSMTKIPSDEIRPVFISLKLKQHVTRDRLLDSFDTPTTKCYPTNVQNVDFGYITRLGKPCWPKQPSTSCQHS